MKTAWNAAMDGNLKEALKKTSDVAVDGIVVLPSTVKTVIKTVKNTVIDKTVDSQKYEVMNRQTKVINVDEYKRDLDDEDLNKLIYTCMLCNDTKVSKDNVLTGDPTETALVDLGFKLNYNPAIYTSYERVDEIPFDSERKLMTTVNKSHDKYIVYTKGGVDEILSICNSYLQDGEIKEDIGNFKKEH